MSKTRPVAWKTPKLPQTDSTNRNGLSWRTIFTDIFYDYAENTKIGGMYYLRKHKTTGYCRVLWTVIPISFLLFGCYLTFELLRSFLGVPTRIVIDRPVPTHKVFFPALTFCHPQVVLDYKAKKFVRKIVLPIGTNTDEILNALPALGMFVENQWGNRPNTNKLSLIDETLKLNNYSVETAVKELGLNCDDFIKACAWAKVDFPCFKSEEHLSFSPTTSYMGMCCSFNYHPDNRSYEAFKAPTFGTRGGLTIIGTGYPQIADGKSGVLFSTGFMMLIHHPYDYPVEGNQMALLKVGTVTSVAVYPTLSSTESNIEDFPIRSRRCLLDYEMDPTTVYRQPACAVACTRKFVYETCKCHPFHMPRPLRMGTMIRDCTALDAACFATNYFNIKRARCEYCLPACSETTYTSHAFSNNYDLRNVSINITPIYRQINVTNLQFTTHVYLANQLANAQKQIVVMPLINFLSNIGGCFSLALGVSFISVIEIFVYLLVRLPRRMKQDDNPTTLMGKRKIIGRNIVQVQTIRIND